MATGDLSNQVPIIQGGGYIKESIIGGMPGPLPDPQQRHWIPDDRDNFISWLRGEFAAANAIIDTLCHHLQMIGKPGEYDFVLSCIQQRRYNWTVVLHMQQYFSVAEVVFALQQVVWLKQALNSDPSGMPPLFVSPENGGGPPWKEEPIIYRDPRGESLVPGVLQHNSISEGHLHGRKETLEMPPKSDDQSVRRRSYSGDQERQQQHQTVASATVESSPHPNRNQEDLAEQATTRNIANRTDSSISETSSLSIPMSPQGVSAKEQKESSDQGSTEPGDWEASKLEAPEGLPAERAPIPYFHIASKEEDDRRQATVKTTKSYSCYEQIDGRMVNTMDGLELHDRVLDKLESSRLLTLIQDTRNAGRRGELGAGVFVGTKKGPKGKGRELLQFGHFHHHSFEDHKRRSFPKDDMLPPVPPYLEAIIDRLVRWHIIPASKRPDCCSINILEEGDYLPPHLDNSHLERPFCTLTVQSDCALVMGQTLTTSGPGDFKGTLQLSLPVGSVLVLQKTSADLARHSIAASPSKRIYITLGKALTDRSLKSHNAPIAGISQSPTLSSAPSSNSWSHSFNPSSNNRQNSSNLPHNTSSRSGGSGYSGPFKSHKYTPVSPSSSSSSGGVLPNPTPRQPPPAQIITNVASSGPPLFSGTPGSSTAGGAFPPPSLPIPAWSPLPRPPPPNRPPSAGTGVFFPAGGASSGPGRPANVSTPRRSGSNSSSSAPPLLQKTNSAPASFASLEAAALAATASATIATSPSSPPGKSPKPTTSSATTSESLIKVVPPVAAFATSLPTENLNVSSGSLSQDAQSEANGAKAGKEDNLLPRNLGRSTKTVAVGNTSRTSSVSTGGVS